MPVIEGSHFAARTILSYGFNWCHSYIVRSSLSHMYIVVSFVCMMRMPSM